MSLNKALRSAGKFLLNVLTTPQSNIYPIQRITAEQRLQFARDPVNEYVFLKGWNVQGVLTNEDRLNIFKSLESNLYQNPNINTLAQFNTQRDPLNPQPYKYTYLTDEEDKRFTEFDSVMYPVNTATRDVDRMKEFLKSYKGSIFQEWQSSLQNLNPYNETSTYNKDTIVIGAGNRIGWKQPSTRHIVGNSVGNSIPLNYENASLSTDQYFSRQIMDDGKIQGTATGQEGKLPYSNYADIIGDAKYGLLRYKTATDAYVNFSKIWSNPSVNDYGTAGTGRLKWEFRPEYSEGNERQSKYDGPYHFFRDDKNANLAAYSTLNYAKIFYNDIAAFGGNAPTDGVEVKRFHRYYPDRVDPREQKNSHYASSNAIKNERIGDDIEIQGSGTSTVMARTNLKNIYERMVRNPKPFNETEGKGQFRASAERYSTNPDIGVFENNNYAAIYPENSTDQIEATVVQKSSVLSGPFLDYLINDGEVVGEIRIDNRSFAKASANINEVGEPDEYNSLLPTRNEREMYLDEGGNQSKDLIFFYFFDLINEIYIPFRATISGIQDQHSPTWDEIKYMGRADSLFIYKGFTRDVSFSFKVYANSIKELIPMWKRINYLVGLTRPSGYTARAVSTAAQTRPNSNPLLAGSAFFNEEVNPTTTGRESQFIVPPMVKFRVGDLYVDQPAILRSVNVSIPDDATWETLRDDSYKYVFGKTAEIEIDAISKQLPNIVDVTVQLAMIERAQSITNENHFGPLFNDEGWQMKLDD